MSFHWLADFVVTIVPMEVVPGQWCPACALPSGVRITYAIGFTLETFTRCADCFEPIR